MNSYKKGKLIIVVLYVCLFLWGIKALFHGFPDIERFFSEWADERWVLTQIMKFGTLDFTPKQIVHPPLYHYLTFIPIVVLYAIGNVLGLFYNKLEFIRFYFNSTQYFFLIGRIMSYLFYWLTAVMLFKIIRLLFDKKIAHITVFAYLLVPRFIFDFATMRPETLLFLNSSVFFYFFLKSYINSYEVKYLLISSFFLGVAVATKYNTLFLGSIFIPWLIVYLRNNNINNLFPLILKMFLCFSIGFFITNPFFILEFKKYFLNLLKFNNLEFTYFWKEMYPANFMVTHLKDATSTMYLNFFGFILLLFGFFSLYKKNIRLFISISFVFLIFEIYFGVYKNSYSPLYFLNPLLPIVALVLSFGIDFVLKLRKKFSTILIGFFVVLLVNNFEIMRDFSYRPTQLQKARAFIEENIPEFSKICIASDKNIPQLNMTKETYYRLIETAPLRVNPFNGEKFSYDDLRDNNAYSLDFRNARVESLCKKPQYDLIRWDKNIKTKKDALEFIETNNIAYIISVEPLQISSKLIDHLKIASVVNRFAPNNKRVYERGDIYLYKVN